MALERLVRFGQRDELVREVAARLLAQIWHSQSVSGVASLCLTGGDLANQVLDEIAHQVADSPVKTQNVHLWWNWDLFVATDNPERNSLQALTRLGGVLTLDPAKVHPIPSSAVATDPETGAAQYAQELAEAGPVDICLLELGSEGQVGAIFPQNLSSNPAIKSEWATGVADEPGLHRPLITLTRAGINHCREIWIMASGQEVAEALRRAHQGDESLPSSYLGEGGRVLWLIDDAACAHLSFHRCTL